MLVSLCLISPCHRLGGCCSWISYWPCKNNQLKQERYSSHLWSDLFTYFSHLTDAAYRYNGTPFAAEALSSLLILIIRRETCPVKSAHSVQWTQFTLELVCVTLCGCCWLMSVLFRISFWARRGDGSSLAVIKVLFWGQIWLSGCVRWFIRQARAGIQRAWKIASCQWFTLLWWRNPGIIQKKHHFNWCACVFLWKAECKVKSTASPPFCVNLTILYILRVCYIKAPGFVSVSFNLFRTKTSRIKNVRNKLMMCHYTVGFGTQNVWFNNCWPQ